MHTYFITDTVVRSQKIGHKSNFCASVNLSIYYIHIVSCIYIYIHTHTHTHTQGVSRLVDITAGGDFLGLCDQKKFIQTCVRFWTVTEL